MLEYPTKSNNIRLFPLTCVSRLKVLSVSTSIIIYVKKISLNPLQLLLLLLYV
jgi:hypothetical protein